MYRFIPPLVVLYTVVSMLTVLRVAVLGITNITTLYYSLENQDMEFGLRYVKDIVKLKVFWNSKGK